MDKEIEFRGRCDFCNREQRKATKDDLNGIVLINPEEKWLCTVCQRWHIEKSMVIGQ